MPFGGWLIFYSSNAKAASCNVIWKHHPRREEEWFAGISDLLPPDASKLGLVGSGGSVGARCCCVVAARGQNLPASPPLPQACTGGPRDGEPTGLPRLKSLWCPWCHAAVHWMSVLISFLVQFWFATVHHPLHWGIFIWLNSFKQ